MSVWMTGFPIVDFSYLVRYRLLQIPCSSLTVDYSSQLLPSLLYYINYGPSQVEYLKDYRRRQQLCERRQYKYMVPSLENSMYV